MAVDRPTQQAYVDEPIRDLEEAVDAAYAAADVLALAEPVLVRAGMNAIFRAGDVALRVSQPTVDATVSLDLARFLRERGLAVPEPVHGEAISHEGVAVTAWGWIDDTGRPVDWEAVGAAIRTVHRIDARTLPVGVPLPSAARFPWWDFDALLSRAVSRLDTPARVGLEAAVARHRDWADFADVVVCHGDVHPGNVMMGENGPVVIDWDLLCAAPAAWDHGPMMTWESRWGGRAGEYAAFASGYGRSYLDDAVAGSFAELRLVAATLMRVIAAEHEPRAAAEAERRLRYWRGDPVAPMWAAQ